MIADTRGLCGSPPTVTEIIRKQMSEAGADYFVGQFAFGDLTLDETLHSIDLFAREVMPALRAHWQKIEAWWLPRRAGAWRLDR
jgi:hypothetical protein